MRCRPLRTMIDDARARMIRVVASDVDGTLTHDGKFSPDVLLTFSRLREKGLRVVPVTGRSAGWVQGIAAYLPVSAAVAENGGVLFLEDGERTVLLPTEFSDEGGVGIARQRLGEMFEILCLRSPVPLRVTADNAFRMTDFTFHIEGLSSELLTSFHHHCEDEGLSFTYSTIHGHIMYPGQSKARGLRHLLTLLPNAEHGASLDAHQVLTIGDSPNDSPLFVPGEFGLSVGVGNIARYLNVMEHAPEYLCARQEASGFVEAMDVLATALSN